MNCKTIQKLLPELESGELSPTLKEEVESHLALCENCRKAAEIQKTLILLTESALPEPENIPELTGKLEGTIKTPSGIRKFNFRWIYIPAAIAACLFLIISIPSVDKPEALPNEDFEKALEVYDKAFTVSEDSRDVMLLKSLNLLEKFQKEYPEDSQFGPIVYLFLADCYNQTGNLDMALQTYHDILKKFPKNNETCLESRAALFNIYLNHLNNIPKAEEFVTWIVENNNEWSGLPELCLAIGNKYESVDKWAAHKWYSIAESSHKSISANNLLAARKRDMLEDQLREDSFITDWYIIGPFDNTGKTRLHSYPPESTIDLHASYDGKGGKILWKHVIDPEGDRKGHVNFGGPAIYQTFDADLVGYALTYMYSPEDRNVRFLIGSDDAVRVWLNDEIVWSNPVERGIRPDQDRTEPMFVHKGWNKILVRVWNWAGPWGFYFRVVDKDYRLLSDVKFDPLRGEK